MSKYSLSKGVIEVSGHRVKGTLRASTSMQQSPIEMLIDTPIDEVGPISIGEVVQFRVIGALLPFVLGVILGGITMMFAFSGPDQFEVLAYAAKGLPAPEARVSSFAIVLSIIWLVGGVIGSVFVLKKFKVYMAQFSNGGQTVYVPYLRRHDFVQIQKFNSELKVSKEN